MAQYPVQHPYLQFNAVDPTFDLIATKMATKAPPLPGTVVQFQQGILPLANPTPPDPSMLQNSMGEPAQQQQFLSDPAAVAQSNALAADGPNTQSKIPGISAPTEAAGAGVNWSGIMQGLSMLQPQQQRPVPQAPMPQQSRTVQLQTAPTPAPLPVIRPNFATLMGGR